MEKENKKKNKKSSIVYAIIIAVIAGLMALVIYMLTNKKETHTYRTQDNGEISALVCTTNDNESSFFASETASSINHTVKLIYKDNKVEKISYEYDGKYNSSEEAKHDDAVLHAKFNIYLGEHNIEQDVLTPVFQHNGDGVTIRLYLDNYNEMNSAIGKIFYIGSGIKDTVAKNSLEETKKIYENKRFSCIISD